MTRASYLRPTLRSIAFVVSAAVCSCVLAKTPPSKANDSFSTFWVTFRTAVANKDYTKLATLTKFPFEVRGPHDTDPVRKYDREQFASVAARLVDEPVSVYDGSKTVETSMLAVVADRATVGDAVIAADQARIETFAFTKIGDRWLWTRAYSDGWAMLPKPAR